MTQARSAKAPGPTLRSVAGLPPAAPTAKPGVVDELSAMATRLGRLPDTADSAEQIDRIAALDRLAAAVAAARAAAMTRFAALQVAEQSAAGVPRSHLGRGVAEQLSYARRISPATAARELHTATALQAELPAVFDALRAGDTSEWAAQLAVKETRELPPETRRRIAEELAPELPTMSPRQVETAARRMAYEADPQAVLRRSRTARADRHVSLRPAPDTMAILTAFLPVEQGVAAYASLDQYAKAQRAAGDPRSLGQVRADTLVERLTGQATAAAVPVEINLTMTADTLLTAGADQTPANLNGYGPIPADLALDLAANAYSTRPALEPDPDAAGPDAPSDPAPKAGLQIAPDDPTSVWIRRMLTDPVDDTIAHIDTARRRFDGALARLIRHRDQLCRESYCNAQISHIDHVEQHRDGGPTSAVNGAGMCERGNYAKEMPGWSHHVVPDGEGSLDADDGRDRDGSGGGAQRIEIRTPTGHRYISAPPPALGPGGNYQTRARRRARRKQPTEKRRRRRRRTKRPVSPPRRN